MAVSEVVGEGFLVEGALAKHHPGLPGCKGAPDHRDGGVGVAEGDALLLVLQLVLKHDRRLVAAAFRTRHLERKKWSKSQSRKIFTSAQGGTVEEGAKLYKSHSQMLGKFEYGLPAKF